MKIGIVGAGFVGLSFAAVLGSKGYQVIVHDVDAEKLEKIKAGKPPFFEPKLKSTLKNALKSSLELTSDIKKIVNGSDLIFITVGTPIGNNGSISLTYIKDVVNKIAKVLKKSKNKPVIVLKSTVTPGTNNLIRKILEEKSGKKAGIGFSLLSNPEFLREGSTIADTIKPHVVVMGGENTDAINKLAKFYKKFHASKIPFIITNPQTAEMIKYANNSFLATKISFINQIANICQSIQGTDVDDVAKAIGIDPRIGNQFLKAGPGYGGSCLPKDLQALIAFSAKSAQTPTLLKAVQKTNSEQIENLISFMKKILSTLKGKRITILGLSFKEDSDDIRDSVSINLIRRLLKYKTKIIVHDPMAIKNTKAIIGDKISYAKSISEALKKSECVVIMTPWKQYTKLNNKDLQLMKTKIIVDTRRLLSKKKLDAKYYAIGLGR